MEGTSFTPAWNNQGCVEFGWEVELEEISETLTPPYIETVGL